MTCQDLYLRDLERNHRPAQVVRECTDQPGLASAGRAVQEQVELVVDT